MARPRVPDGGEGLQIWCKDANTLNKQSRTTDKGWYSSPVFDKGLTAPYRKKKSCYQLLHGATELAGFCEHGNEPPGSIRGGESLDWICDY
jgi:hypothetical protein